MDDEVEFIEEPEVKGSFWHWKRYVHLIVTLILIAFLIWYYLPDNRLIRSVDVCGYYAGMTNQTCSCTPITTGNQQTSTTIFYPNYSYYKIKPISPMRNFNLNLSLNLTNVTR